MICWILAKHGALTIASEPSTIYTDIYILRCIYGSM